MARRMTFTEDQILDAIRAAADRCGQPLSHGRYDGVSREVAGPSSARIIQRFGSWGRACAAAGVTSAAAAREYAQRWDRAAVLAAVAEYLNSEGAAGTYADYVRWAQSGPERPSGATVRNVLGAWSAAKADASGP